MAPIVYWSHSFVGKRSILVGIRLVRRSKPLSCWQHTWKNIWYVTIRILFLLTIFFYMQNHPQDSSFWQHPWYCQHQSQFRPQSIPKFPFLLLKKSIFLIQCPTFPNLLWKSQFLLTRSFLQAKSLFLPIKHDKTKIFRGEIHVCTIEIPSTWKCSSSYKWIYNQSSSGDILTYGS